MLHIIIFRYLLNYILGVYIFLKFSLVSFKFSLVISLKIYIEYLFF